MTKSNVCVLCCDVLTYVKEVTMLWDCSMVGNNWAGVKIYRDYFSSMYYSWNSLTQLLIYWLALLLLSRVSWKKTYFIFFVFFHESVWECMKKMDDKTNPKLNSEIKIWKWVQFGASEPENTLILLPVCSAFCWTSFDYQEQKENKKKVFPVSDKLSKVQTFPLIVAGKRPLSAEARLADALRSTFSRRQKDWVTSALRVNTCAICPSCRFTRVFNMLPHQKTQKSSQNFENCVNVLLKSDIYTNQVPEIKSNYQQQRRSQTAGNPHVSSAAWIWITGH